MDRLQRLHQLWSWLPAFRAVAETEHLPTAAARLGVSPPALSRSIALIEDRMAVRLFERRRRRLVLNDAGRALLDSLRDAMRLLDDGWDRATQAEDHGTVRIAVASGAIGALLAPALDAVRRSHPGITPHLLRHRSDAIPALLLAGAVDIGLVEQHPGGTELRVELARQFDMHVYCGPRSTLWKVARPTRAVLLEQPFVVPSSQDADGWPSEVPRVVGVVSDSMALAIDLCARGPWLIAMPESIEAMSGAGRLRRVPTSIGLRPISVYAVTRRPAGRAAVSTDKIARVLSALLARPSAA